VRSQQRAAAAAGSRQVRRRDRADHVLAGRADKPSGAISTQQVTVPPTKASVPTPRSKAFQDSQRHARRRITAGNASQFSDGASAAW
jgi:acetyl-CoA C-acetyltransferase